MNITDLTIPGVTPVLRELIPDPIPFSVMVQILAALGHTPEWFLAECERRAQEQGRPTPALDAVRKAGES